MDPRRCRSWRPRSDAHIHELDRGVRPVKPIAFPVGPFKALNGGLQVGTGLDVYRVVAAHVAELKVDQLFSQIRQASEHGLRQDNRLLESVMERSPKGSDQALLSRR